MFPGHLRELVLYERTANGEIVKKREIVPSFYHPSKTREVYESSHCDIRHVFPPDGNFLPVWGIVMMLTILCQAITVPFMMAFAVEDTPETVAADLTCTLVYILDIAVTCNTGFYKKGLLVKGRRKIFLRYLKTWFFIDFVSTFPYDWFFQEPLNTGNQPMRAASVVRVFKIGRLLRSLRLIRLVKVRSYLMKVRQKLIDTKLAIVFTAVLSLTMMLGLAHWVACGFFAVSQVRDSTDTWIYHSSLQDALVDDQYIASLYWAVTTLTTTGYGDIHPINTDEKIYGLFIMIVSAGSFSFIIGKIGASIASVDRDAKEHKDLNMAVTSYLTLARVPRAVVSRATEYIDYHWESRKKRKLLDNQVMSHFSGPLQREISKYIYAPIISRVALFNLFGQQLIIQLACAVNTEVFAPDDIIFSTEQKSTEMYFIEKGKVTIYHMGTGFAYATLLAGNYFGELAFFTDEERCASARCTDFAELLSLRRELFMSLMTPELLYTYRQIQDMYRAKDYYAMGMACYLCEASTHLALECPRNRVRKDTVRIWQKWISSKSSTVPVTPGVTVPNFQRRERKVNRNLRFSLDNTKRLENSPEVKHKKMKEALRVWRGRYMEDFTATDEWMPHETALTTEPCLLATRNEFQSDAVESDIPAKSHKYKPNLAASMPLSASLDRRVPNHGRLRRGAHKQRVED